MVLIERPTVSDEDSTSSSPSGHQRRIKKSHTHSPQLGESALLANTFEQVDVLLAGGLGTDQYDDGMSSVGPLEECQSEQHDASKPPLNLQSVRAGRGGWMFGLAALCGVFGIIALAIAPNWRAGAATEGFPPPISSAVLPAVPAEEVEQLPDQRVMKSATETVDPPIATVLKPVVKDVPATADAAPPPESRPDSSVAASIDDDVPMEQPDLSRIDASLFGEPASTTNFKVVVTGNAPTSDARNRVGQAIESLKLPETTLSEFTRLMEQIADMPITIEPDALAMARIDASHPMAIDVREHSVGEALAKGLRPLNLGYQLTGPHVLIRHRATLENRPESLRLDVSDLLGPHTSVTSIASLVVACGVVKTDDSAEASPLQTESKSIVVHAPPPTQFRVVRFLEQLRLASGLPTRTVYGRQIQATRSQVQRGNEVLRQTVVPQWPRNATLSQIVESLHRQTGAYFLIDWPALQTAGIYYSSRFEFSGQPGTLRQLLDSFDQVGLHFHAVDDHTIGLTSRDCDSRMGVVAFYSIGEIAGAIGTDPRQLTVALKSAFTESIAKESRKWSSIDPRFIYDPGSEHLIICLPASLHSRFERGLDRLREASKLARSTFPNRRWRS